MSFDMKYVDADRLQAEIRKLRGEKPFCDDSSLLAYLHGLSKIEDFVDSLQQEQPEVDLEKEIDACWRNWLSPSNQKEVEGILPKTEFAMYAHHFWNKGYNARKEK